MPHVPAVFTLAVIAVMFVFFVREVFPPEVTAMAGAAVLLTGGVLPVDEVLVAFSNPAPWTIAAMFILSGGLVRTGVLANISRLITRHGALHPALVVVSFAGMVIFASAFMNNTPIVVVLIPVAVQLAQTMGQAPSKLLIPLSYLAIMGGVCTLIGTSTNLLVDGVARSAGLAPFTLFEITPLAVCLAVIGVIYLRIAVPALLPNRDSMVDLLGTRKRMKFFTEVVVPEGSPLIAAKVMEVPTFRRDGMRVIDVLRGEESLRRQFPDVALQEGDRVVLRTEMNELLGLKDSNQVTLVDRVGSKRTTTVEALISPDCKLVGRSLGSLRLRRRYGVYPLAVHRRNQNIGRQLDEVVVRVGDTLLLEGAQEDIRRLATDVELVDIAEPTERPYRRDRAPLMVAVLAAVVGLSAMNVAPIHVLALLGVVVVLLTGILDAEEAFSYIDARLMALIFAMLAIGIALDRSGAVQLIVDAIAPSLRGLSPWITLACVYALTTVLTEVVTNNAVAVVMTPIAIALGQSLGLDPRPLVVAVMVGASASFATPIGYQTNTLVYGPGGYRFTDFMRIGIPMNVIFGISTCLLIPLFWPLHP
ncbi:MAG TPA: SLC13 family permease [Amaricoccus sp.]|uniref:SLC13 family permease n=1 Tax=Amaricoccus sp. TaxID=1872485 RepID=UPI002BA5F9F6|nr:SLC13 family permease [Amaricoccus sp.]HMQ94972.1 SLC13 family permease [Amaricoccus sp.]HMR54829.1 SLC13 family permease [Amaricoccus sp.]HMR62189.1 SLC13 family permease [Amaricoccus sp.]HMU01832.1 SLC13 family permease [Amaricoccus sp.]